MHRIGFKRYEANHCYYVKSFDNSYIILLLYVDDMLIAGSSIEEINNLKKQLSKQFAIIQTVCNEGFGSCKANPWYENH